jgi:putative ABC transport system permease protein
MHTAVAGQVLVSAVLIIFAGLMVKTVTQLNAVPLGFKADHLLTFYVSLPELQYRDGSQVRTFFDELLARLRSLPDIQAASAINALYINWSRAFVLPVLIEGRPPPTGSQPTDTHVRIVDPNIHRVLQIPVLRGRSFDAHDASDGPQVAVINESMAMRYFAGEDPLGRRVAVESAGPGTPKWRTVVGVIGNVRQQGLDAEVYPEIQLPYQQSPFSTMAVLVRTIGDPVALTPVIRAQVQALDPNLPMMLVQTMDDVLDASMARRRFGMRLLTMFASIALSLTAIGLYGVIAACVSGRAREIAVRLAIGASSRQVRQDVVGELMQMVVAGLGAGLSLAVIASRYIEPLLFAVPRTDIGTYATTAAILVATALGSSYLAARRIMGIDTATVLRAE